MKEIFNDVYIVLPYDPKDSDAKELLEKAKEYIHPKIEYFKRLIKE
ncbi:MAG: hypothetical protein ACFFCI_04510 [Promethearchaeota archaeon]